MRQPSVSILASLYDAFQCFMDLHNSDKERSAPLKNMVAGDKESEGTLLS